MGHDASIPSRSPRRPDGSAHKARMRDHVDRIIKQLEANELKFNSGDLQVVANNMWSITQFARRHQNLSQEKIYSCTVRDGSSGPKASQNARYYEAPPGSAGKRPIIKSPPLHIKLLRHIGTLTEGDFIELAQEWLANTALLQGIKIGNSEPDHVDRLIQRINSIAQKLDEHCDIRSYFKRLERTLVSYDVRSNIFYQMDAYDTLLSDIQWHPDWTVPWEICSDEAPPWPSVALYQERLTPTISGTVLYDANAPTRIDRAGNPWAVGIQAELASKIEVEASLWLEVRLALAPVAPNTKVNPVFELRFKTRLHDHSGYVNILNEFTYWDGDPNIGGVLLNDEWNAAILTIDIPDEHSRAGVAGLSDQIPSEYCYFLYFPVTKETCRALFDRHPRAVEFLIGEPYPAVERWPTFFPHGTLGARIEALILYPDSIGVDLVAELKRDAQQKLQRFDEVYRLRIEEVEAAHERADARLKRL